MTQPEALRLADLIDENPEAALVVKAAAAELRRLHALLGKANALCRIRLDRIEKLEAVMENAQGELERISLVQTGIGIQAQPVAKREPEIAIGLDAIHKLQQSIAQERQQQPVACQHTWVDESSKRQSAWRCSKCNAYAFMDPPPRQPLTDEEISKLWDEHKCPLFGRQGINPTEFARAIEAAHNIKEN
jgi:hypothetical protein